MKEDYYDKATEFEELYKAMKLCCRNVRWKSSVIGYENNAITNIIKLRQDLVSGKYKISDYQHFTIYEPKRREIVATRLRDRLFQRSLCNCGLYEDITEHLIADNCACMVGRGTDYAIGRLKKHMRSSWRVNGKTAWVLKCDIRHFFPSIRHDKAKAAVRKYVSDPRAADAVCTIIDSFEGDTGIGLGSQISQLVALLVLNDMDHAIKERMRIRYYVRYMDDFILIDGSQEHLQSCWAEIARMLAELGMELNDKTNLFPIRQGIWFLQWKFFYSETGKIIMTMNKTKIRRERKRIAKLLDMEISGERPIGTAAESLKSWLSNAERGNTYRIRQEMTDYFFKTWREKVMTDNTDFLKKLRAEYAAMIAVETKQAADYNQSIVDYNIMMGKLDDPEQEEN